MHIVIEQNVIMKLSGIREKSQFRCWVV